MLNCISTFQIDNFKSSTQRETHSWCINSILPQTKVKKNSNTSFHILSSKEKVLKSLIGFIFSSFFTFSSKTCIWSFIDPYWTFRTTWNTILQAIWLIHIQLKKFFFLISALEIHFLMKIELKLFLKYVSLNFLLRLDLGLFHLPYSRFSHLMSSPY